MNALTRLAKLVSQGTWSFYSDGVLFTRPNLSYRARFNLILQLISKNCGWSQPWEYPTVWWLNRPAFAI